VRQLSLFADDIGADAPLSLVPFQRIAEGDVLHVGPPELIGKHEWCHVIYRNSSWDRVSNFYAWRRPEPSRRDGGEWRHERDWPTYDSNRQDYGCPLSLRVLWQREVEARRLFGLADSDGV
jgi:hypothetical protein